MSNILTIGTGGCGNKLLDTQLSILDKSMNIQNSHDGLFINSNRNELQCLPHYHSEFNALVINGAGTGRNKTIGKNSIKREKSKFSNYFATRIEPYEIVNIISSMDGGFGSSSIEMLCRVLKMIKPQVNINLLMAVPKLDSSKKALENTLDTYKEIVKLKDLIKSVTFIDNDKMEKEEEFNRKTMELFLDSFETCEGSIDSNDLARVASSNGYRIPLTFDLSSSNLVEGIKRSLSRNPFIIPSSLEMIGRTRVTCSHLAGLVNKECLDKEDWKDGFIVTDFDKVEYGSNNLLVVGGLPMPVDKMTLLEVSIKDLSNLSNLREETFTPINTTVDQEEKEKDLPKKSEETERKALINILEASFWD